MIGHDSAAGNALETERSTQFASNPVMSSQSRDSLALYAIAALAVLVTLFADVDIAALIEAILARW